MLTSLGLGRAALALEETVYFRGGSELSPLEYPLTLKDPCMASFGCGHACPLGCCAGKM
jgi:hypothetical protein